MFRYMIFSSPSSIFTYLQTFFSYIDFILKLQSPLNMATLLAMPLEIREMIIEVVVRSSRSAPEYSDTVNSLRAPIRLAEPFPRQGGWIRDFKYLVSYISHPADALLLVNHQVHYEAKAVWRRLKGSLICHMDIIFANEAEVWPSFLSVYNPNTHLDKVRAQIRAVGLISSQFHLTLSDPTLEIDFWNPPTGGPFPYPCLLLALFLSFLQTGPLLEQDTSDKWIEEQNFAKGLVDRQMTVSTLEIDVITSTDESLLLSADDETKNRLKGLFNTILSDVESVVTRAYYRKGFGQILYERVGVRVSNSLTVSRNG